MSNLTSNYLTLPTFYEECLSRYGTTPKGVDWPNQDDLTKRFQIMLEVFGHEKEKTEINLLDLGCGYGALIDYLKAHPLQVDIVYTGIDISDKMIASARTLFPDNHFQTSDILKNTPAENSYDYIIMNGLLTEKRSLSWQEMAEFAEQIITVAYRICKKGLAFNVMSQHVDWCDPNLFYWSFDDVSRFLCQRCTRNIVIRQDYGLYEYTTYVYKNPISK